MKPTHTLRRLLFAACTTAGILSSAKVNAQNLLAQLPSLGAGDAYLPARGGKIATDGVNVYFADYGGCDGSGCHGMVWAVPVGGGVATPLATGLTNPQDVSLAESQQSFDGNLFFSGAGVGVADSVGYFFIYNDGFSDGPVVGDAVANDFSDFYVHWSHNSGGNFTIFTAPYGGGTRVQLFGDVGYVAGLVVDDQMLYAATAGAGGTPAIRATPKLTAGPVQILSTEVDQPVGLALAYGTLFWANASAGGGQGSIKAVAIGGGGPTRTLHQGGNPADIAADSGCVYWTEPLTHQVLGVPVTGGNAFVVFQDAPDSNPTNITVDSSFVYVVSRAPSINQSFLYSIPKQCGGPWKSLNYLPQDPIDTCELLTDGTVMCHALDSHAGGTNRWDRLSPDINGSYANGTWVSSRPIQNMPIATDTHAGWVNMPYEPLYFASAVLADGRVVVMGGEWLGDVSDPTATPPETNIGFLYDPVRNTWLGPLSDVFGGGNVGDGMGVVLKDGTFIKANVNTTNFEALDPVALGFSSRNPMGKTLAEYRNAEEGWHLLPDGTLLSVDALIASSYEIYDPATNTWGHQGSTPVNMAGSPDQGNSEEVGPAVLRPDGRLVTFSGNSLGKNALYDSNPGAGTWSHTASMDFPQVPGQSYFFAVKDGPAALLPNGNVLVMASPTNTTASAYLPTSHFYEFDFNTNTLFPVNDAFTAEHLSSFQGRMLVLPTGEVLFTALGAGALLYSNGGQPQSAWRPVITSSPSQIVPGAGDYAIAGRLFNGLSEGAGYGDDAQSATNYPLVRITNTATGHVFYARTHNHSRMGVEALGSPEIIMTQFDVPQNAEGGPSTLVVVANGIPSAAVNVNVVGQQQRGIPAMNSRAAAVLFAVMCLSGIAAQRRRRPCARL
jgi:hypothetical protein